MKHATIYAIDPGDVWAGLAVLLVGQDPLLREEGLARSRDGRVVLQRCTTGRTAETMDWLERHLWQASHLVVERYQLYPWLARQQGFSEFHTPEMIGQIKWIAGKLDLPVHLQDASGNLKQGRAYAEQDGFPVVERRLGHGKYAYYGPDFDLPGKPHRRDAAAHAVQFAHVSGLYRVGRAA